MKKIAGNIWYVERDYQVSVGFTSQCLQEKLQECFHVLPADTLVVKQRGPLMVLETNDGLEAVHSPVAGKVLFFSDKARNFPDRLTEEDVVMTIALPKPVQQPQQPPKATKKVSTRDRPVPQGVQQWENIRNDDWFIDDDVEE